MGEIAHMSPYKIHPNSEPEKHTNPAWVMNIYGAISLAANAHKTAKGRTK